MKEHTIFLKWLWLFCLIAVGLGYAGYSGFFHTVLMCDMSHVTSVLIMPIFLVMTFCAGRFSWKVDQITSMKKVESETQYFLEQIKCWASACQNIGIGGTAWGVVIIFATLGIQESSISKAGTTLLNVAVSIGAYQLLTWQARHIFVNVRKKILSYEISE